MGYITWVEYEQHLAQMLANSQAYAPHRLNPPREGPALLQGLVICGRCGDRMTVRYHQRSGKRIIPDYVCQRAGIAKGVAPCQRIMGRELDAAIGEVLLEVATPQLVAQTLALHEELRMQVAEAEHLRQMQLDRAQYEADLAQRRYLRVDPDNRMVADVLEAEWNAKLRALADAREVVEQQRTQQQDRVSVQEREKMNLLLEQFSHFWHNPSMTPQERKRLLRLVISDVTVTKTDCIKVQIRFRGGATRSLEIPLPSSFSHSRLTPAQTLGEIDRLLNDHPDKEVAEQLNIEGYRTFVGLEFTAWHVYALRRKHGLKDLFTRLREAGYLTAREVAEQLGITEMTVYRWYHEQRFEGVRYNERGSCLFRLSQSDLEHPQVKSNDQK